MSRRTLKVLSFVTIAIGLVAIVAVLKQHYRTHITISPDKTEFSLRSADTVENKFDKNTQANHFRKLSVPTDCYDDGAPSVCGNNHDAIKSDFNHTCKCSTTINGKTYAKQYDIKSTYEYSLGIGEDNIVANTINKFDICGAVCKSFSDQIVAGTFLPREYFTISHECGDATEITVDDEVRFAAECKCTITDAENNSAPFTDARIKPDEFVAKTAVEANDRCNRWCNRLCDTVFSDHLGKNPDYSVTQ